MRIHPKVTSTAGGSAVGSAITVIVVWLCKIHGFIIPDDVAQALTVLFGFIVGIGTGYATPSPANTEVPNGKSG